LNKLKSLNVSLSNNEIKDKIAKEIVYVVGNMSLSIPKIKFDFINTGINNSTKDFVKEHLS
jgi:hypothetical protein